MQKSVVGRLVLINVAVFIAVHILAFVARPAGTADIGVWLVLPPSWAVALLRPWTLLTYMFTHTDFFHILANMLWLYCFGIVFLDMASDRRLVATYLLGGVVGGVAYLSMASVVPSFGLLGSSASVMAVMTAAVLTKPDYRINLWLFGMVKIKWIVLFVVAFALLQTPAGLTSLCPHAAHVGGIVAGALVAADLRYGFTRNHSRRRKAVVLPPLHRQNRQFDEARLDELLDRVRVSGYQSLSSAEKLELKRLSEQIPKR